MAAETRILQPETAGPPPDPHMPGPSAVTGLLCLLVWIQIVVVFVFLEFALWAPTTHIRNRWSVVAMCALLVFVLTDRPSLNRLGLGLPTMVGAGLILGASLAAVALLLILVSVVGGQIPANPGWFPNLQSAWGYAVWALIQEFILQSFFFTRFEELYGSSAAVWIAATLFAAAHLPSPILTTGTLIGALFFCEMFRRYRSIYPLGIAHALLGLTIAITMPDILLHHMRVGLGYLQH